MKALGALALLGLLHAQSKFANPAKASSTPDLQKTVDLIVRVDAYDWAEDTAIDSFGRQFDTLIVRVEKVVHGDVLEPWIRVDYWGSNRHNKEDRLPGEVFEPGHRWRMRLSPLRVSEKNYRYCGPRQAGTVRNVDPDGNVLSEYSAIRAVSPEFEAFPDISGLKCYELRREDVHEVSDSE